VKKIWEDPIFLPALLFALGFFLYTILGIAFAIGKVSNSVIGTLNLVSMPLQVLSVIPLLFLLIIMRSPSPLPLIISTYGVTPLIYYLILLFWSKSYAKKFPLKQQRKKFIKAFSLSLIYSLAILWIILLLFLIISEAISPTRF
jgi:hypothetical protein